MINFNGNLWVRFVLGLFELGQGLDGGGDFSWDRGRSGQVVSYWLVTVLIGDEVQGDLDSFGADVIVLSLLGVSSFVSRSLLGVSLIASGSIGSSVAVDSSNPMISWFHYCKLSIVRWNFALPPFAAAVRVANIRLADDGDFGFAVRGAGGSGGHGQESGDNELLPNMDQHLNIEL